MSQFLLSPAQCRMARALLNWTQPDLADRCSLAPMTVSKFEKEDLKYRPEARTLQKITSVFELAGIEFSEGDGVQRKISKVRTLEGQQGYWEFYDDVYETVKNEGGEILVSNVDELLFTKWLGERGMVHKNRMNKLSKEKKFFLKILIREGDHNFTVPEYAEYRWTPKDRFSGIPFYVYGGNLAIILFEQETVSVFIIDNPKIAAAYKTQFDVMWDQSILIPKERLVTVRGTELDQ